MNGCAYELVRPAGPDAGMVLLCDHAANAVPECYGSLGLSPDLLASHIAYDIGAAEVVRRLSDQFRAPAILGVWSRLLIDLNRGEDDPTLVMKLSDGAIIPGNREASAEEIARRIRDFHTPYHTAIAAEIARIGKSGRVPVLVSLHSFTPRWKGKKRKWEIGVLWDRDGRLAQPLMARLEEAGFVVGDNEPYSGTLEKDCLYRHGTVNGLPHVLIEIRQDLIANETASRGMADKLHRIIDAALADMGPPQIRLAR